MKKKKARKRKKCLHIYTIEYINMWMINGKKEKVHKMMHANESAFYMTKYCPKCGAKMKELK